MADIKITGLKRDQTENQLEHPGMSLVFASDEKHNLRFFLCLSFAHTFNICLECGGGQRCEGDGKWREGRQVREKREGDVEGKEIS